MNKNLISSLDFNTAKAIESECFDHEKEKAALAGYTVTEEGIIGKNALTGEDAPDCQLTVRYSEIKEENGKFYIDDVKDFNPKGDYVREVKAELITGQIIG